jgi:Mrp family chromosome partitioning ATPase
LGAGVIPTDDRSTQNQATLIATRENAQGAARRIGYRGNPEELLATVTVSPTEGSDFVSVQARRKSPELAAATANAFAQQYVATRKATADAALQRTLIESRRELATIPNDADHRTERDDLQANIRRLKLARALPTAGVEQVDPAVPPAVAVSPRPKRTAAFALVLALIAAFVIAFVLERFDRRLKRVSQVEQAFGLPVLAVVPHVSKPARMEGGTARVAPDIVEAFRQLRMNLDLATLEGGIKRVLVTSAMPGEGKSTVVRNLALVERERGWSVAVVDADLRKPSLSRLFAVEGDNGGLTEVLTGARELREAISRVASPLVSAASPGNGGGRAVLSDPAVGTAGGIARLDLLGAGPAPADPQMVLASDRMSSLLAQMGTAYDCIIIDSPPMLPVSDTMALLGQADAVILVCRMDQSDRDHVVRMLAMLRRVPDVRLIGVVINDVDDAGGYGYTY